MIYRQNIFAVDSQLFNNAKKLKSIDFSFNKIGSRYPRVVISGTGVSGNIFVDSKQKRLSLINSYNALITDMESQAVLQVSIINNIPCLIFRSASDLAGGSGSETAEDEMAQFFETAAENSSRVVMRYLENLTIW